MVRNDGGAPYGISFLALITLRQSRLQEGLQNGRLRSSFNRFSVVCGCVDQDKVYQKGHITVLCAPTELIGSASSWRLIWIRCYLSRLIWLSCCRSGPMLFVFLTTPPLSTTKVAGHLPKPAAGEVVDIWNLRRVAPTCASTYKTYLF